MSLPSRRSVVRLSSALYARESLDAGARQLAGRGRALWRREGSEHVVEIWAAGPGRSSRRLAGEFLNEALSHEYRRRVIVFNRGFSAAVMGRVLATAFPAIPEDPLEMLEPEVREARRQEIEALLRRTADGPPGSSG